MQLTLHDVVKLVIEHKEITSKSTSDFFRGRVLVHMANGHVFDVTMFSADPSKPIPVEQMAPEYLHKETA